MTPQILQAFLATSRNHLLGPRAESQPGTRIPLPDLGSPRPLAPPGQYRGKAGSRAVARARP